MTDAKGSWEEPKHQDGGASVLHLGVTLCGRRDLVCDVENGDPITVHNIPGSVYLGTLTGPAHQAFHRPAKPIELWEKQGLSTAVMCRCALFAHNRSRGKRTTPSPQAFFHCLTASFARSLTRLPLQLPTLGDVLQHLPPESPTQTGSSCGWALASVAILAQVAPAA